MRRREFITLIGGAAAWPFAARARKFFALLGTLIFCLGSTAMVSGQQPPVVGWLSPATAESYSHGAGNPGPHLLRESLARHGLIDGKNVRVEMRLAEGKLERLPECYRSAHALQATPAGDEGRDCRHPACMIPPWRG